jgi:hypothetical protein
MRDQPSTTHTALASVFGMLTLIGTVGPASARQYGPGDVGYLVNLWNTNRARFEGVVQGVDTFSALGTVKTISPSQNGFDVIVDVGMNARIVCSSTSAEVAEGDTVTVSGRIAAAATAASQMTTNQPPVRARDTLGLQSCTVQKALRSK